MLPTEVQPFRLKSKPKYNSECHYSLAILVRFWLGIAIYFVIFAEMYECMNRDAKPIPRIKEP